VCSRYDGYDFVATAAHRFCCVIMDRIQKLRRQSKFENLFWDDGSSHPLRQLIEQPHKTVERHVEMLEVTQEKETDFFWQEFAASNLLAFLYMTTNNGKQALEQLNRTLERDPHNLNALVGSIRLLDKIYRTEDAGKRVSQYHDLTKNRDEMEKQISICEGEIAYACSFLGPEFYMQAIDRYEALLDSDSKVWEMTEKLNGFVIRWKYYLAYTYNRMLNKGQSEKLAGKLGTKDTSAIFDKISQLYVAVIESGDVFHQGKAMIDLVDTYKKCDTSGNNQHIQFPSRYGSVDQFVKKALDTARWDPHVLERCGRHYRQRACTKKEFEEAVAIFDGLLESHSTRHVAWHHKGLACRALWHIVGKYDEARIYSNRARKGDKRRVRKQRTRCAYRSDGAAASAAECSQNRVALSVGLRLPDQDAMSVSGLHNINDVATATQETTLKSTVGPHQAPRQLPTLPARNRHEIGDVPSQTKKPDFFDRLRTSNPLAKEDRSREFLVKAKECFEKAKAITRETCSPYRVDLARCLISLGLFDAAEDEFAAVDSLASAINNNDTTYLYEQWALLRHQRAQPDQPIDEVACLYRKAILSAVRARERSRMAFYRLKDLLKKELEVLERDADNAALQMEYSVLYNSVEKFSQSREILVEALEKDENTRETAWKLITLLSDRRHKHDAATAFMYLAALHEARQLDVHSSDDKLRLLDVVRQVVRDDDQTNADRSHQTFGEIFRWMIGNDCIPLQLDDGCPKPFEDCADICILAPNRETPGLDTVIRVLRDVCGIKVSKAFSEGFCDALPGGPVIDSLLAVVANSKSVVVVDNHKNIDNQNEVFVVLEQLMTLPAVKVCLASVDDSDTNRRYVAFWPRITISPDPCDDIELAYKLIKAILKIE